MPGRIVQSGAGSNRESPEFQSAGEVVERIGEHCGRESVPDPRYDHKPQHQTDLGMALSQQFGLML